MATISNVQLWNKIRDFFPSFQSHTAEATADTFTTAGWESINQVDPQAVNEFFELSLRVYLMTVNISHAKDPLEAAGFGEYFAQPYGSIIQKMAVNSIKPVSPAYKGLTTGQSVDPFIVRKPTATERFWKQNFDYQSFITIPDEFQRKQIFISEFGMSEFMAGIMEGLQNGYTIQAYENKLEAIHHFLTSTTHPLKDTQQVSVNIADITAPTEEEMVNLILTIRNVVSAMNLAPQTDAFNALGFSSTQDLDRLKLLIRPGWENNIAVNVMRNTYQRDALNIPIDTIEVPNFGGITYQNTEGASLYPAYNSIGEQIGYNTTEGQNTATVSEGDAVAVDPHENVIAIIADRGLIFEARQNPYTVEPIRNPRGLYTNYWASSPNNTIAVDSLYNAVVITASSEA